MKPVQLIQITAPMAVLKQGDTDYTNTLTKYLQACNIEAHYLNDFSNNPSEQEILGRIHPSLVTAGMGIKFPSRK